MDAVCLAQASEPAAAGREREWAPERVDGVEDAPSAIGGSSLALEGELRDNHGQGELAVWVVAGGDDGGDGGRRSRSGGRDRSRRGRGERREGGLPIRSHLTRSPADGRPTAAFVRFSGSACLGIPILNLRAHCDRPPSQRDRRPLIQFEYGGQEMAVSGCARGGRRGPERVGTVSQHASCRFGRRGKGAEDGCLFVQAVYPPRENQG